MSHETASEGRLTYSEAISNNKSHYINLVKDMSWLNSRGHDHTDREGNVIGYWCDVTVVLDSAADWLFGSAPNTWKMRNSFRKFHFARDDMFRQAGVTKKEMGKYGRTIRPFLETGMVDYTDKANPKEAETLVPIGCTDAAREWSYTTLGSSPGWQVGETGSGGLSLVDEFRLTICDDNQTESTATAGTTTKFSTAGMIHSYNLDRMEVVTPADGETIEGPNNPLAMIRFTGAAGGQVMEIAEDQEEEATPYDINDDGDSTEVAVKAIAQLSVATASVWNGSAQVANDTVVPKQVTLRNVFIPAGLLKLYASAADGTAAILITVHGKWLCKDYA